MKKKSSTQTVSYTDPVTALALLLVGVLSLCLAVLYPMQSLFANTSSLGFVSDTVLVIPADTLIVVAGLLVISAATTTLGVLVLFLRL